MKPPSRPARAALLYLAFASLWVVASDRLLAMLVRDPDWLVWAGPLKGGAFIVLTALLLYWLLRRQAGAPGAAEPKPRRLLVMLLALPLAVPLVGYGLVHLQGRHIQAESLANLAAIADLKADQIEAWLAENRKDAEALAGRLGLIQDIAAWRINGDPAARGRILQVLDELKRIYRYDVELRDETGHTLILVDGKTRYPAAPELSAQALQTDTVRQGELYWHDGGVYLDYAVPMVYRSTHALRDVGVLMLHVPAKEFLFPLVQAWPTPSPSAESMLVRKEGNQVLFLSGLRHRRGGALDYRLPLSSPDLPSAIALRTGQTAPLEGRDYRGVPVLAALRPIQGTGWHLVAKVDRAELMRPLETLVFWVSSIALIAVTTVALALLMLWRQQQRAHALALRGEAVEKGQLLKLFYDLPFLGMAISDPVSKRFLQVNDRLCEMLGHDRDELLAATWMQITHPDDRAENLARFERALADGLDSLRLDKRYVRKDGSVLEAEAHMRCVRRPDGTPQYIAVTVEDMAERQQVEAVLRERLALQERLANTAATVPGVLYSYLLRPDGRHCFPYAAGPLEELCGLDAESLARDAAPAFARIHPEDAQRVRTLITESARALGPWRAWFRYQHPRKGEIWLEGHAKPERQADGGVLWQGFMTDITERKHMEQALRRNQADLNRAQAVAHVGSWRLNIRRNELTWSDENHRIFGIPKGTPLTYEAFLDTVHPDDREFVRREWQAGLRGAHYDIEHRLIVDGHVKWVRERAELEFDPQDGLIGGFGTTQDITELKLAQKAVLEADRRKDEFLAMLAHELRNPLAPIRNAAHILEQLPIQDPTLQWAQQVIEHQVSHLARLVDDLLDVSRIARGQILLKQERVEFAPLVRQALEVIRPLAEQKRQRLAVSLPETAPWLDGDPVRLAQVLFNLLENAVKYTPDGGCIDLALEVAADELVLRVSDNGMGIPAALLPRVFDLFQQDERALDRAQGGLGIGLSLVRHLVEMHGGRVSADSPGPGRGATFTVWLPLAAAPGQPPAAPAPAPAGPVGGLKVLVVDDERVVAMSTATWLKLDGNEVRTAHSGPEALELAVQFRPQVVLLDIGLGGMNGYETARRLRQLPEGRDVLLVAITGYGDEKSRALTQAAGFDHHLVKPVLPQTISALLAGVKTGPGIEVARTE